MYQNLKSFVVFLPMKLVITAAHLICCKSLAQNSEILFMTFTKLIKLCLLHFHHVCF